MNVLFHAKTGFFPVNSNPAKERDASVCFLLVSFKEEEYLECASHTKNRKSSEKKRGVTK
ncbi:MAG: hypothetical protein LBT25_01355 [Candidatus Symbiothrix sp.]|nr:hypothetical protein [Candidatus Symbiothrix sp.]